MSKSFYLCQKKEYTFIKQPHIRTMIVDMRKLSILAILISYASLINGSSFSSNTTTGRPHFPIVQVTFHHVSNVFGICLWILLGILAKIGKERFDNNYCFEFLLCIYLR